MDQNKLESLVDEFDALREMGPGVLDKFVASIDHDWIEKALAASGSASTRRRKFPAEQALWLVLGMGLFADRSIIDVVDHLNLVIPGVKSLAASAVTKSRYRLGEKPLEHLFRTLSDAWSSPTLSEMYKGHRLLALDGTCFRLQDTDENFEYFGKPGGRGGPGDAGYPQLRMACLLDVGTRLLVDAHFDRYKVGEQTLARNIKIPAGSLVLMDRGFSSYDAFYSIANTDQSDVLVRLRKTVNPEEVEVLPDGSELVTLTPCQVAQRKNPSLTGTCLKGRIITYKHPEGEESRVFTTLINHVQYPAQELIKLYHDRWEIEIGFDEIKTHMLERKECLRSKLPDGVKQEVWGMLCVYNIVRHEMRQVALERDIEAKRISFRASVLWLRSFLQSTAWGRSPGNIPKHLKSLRSSFDVLILPPRRSKRRYPRHVKIKMSTYNRNRGKRKTGQESANPVAKGVK